MAKRKRLTPEEKRHRVAVALPHYLAAYDANPTDPRWQPLENLGLWHGTMEEVRQWFERDAQEAETLFTQLMGTLEQASPSEMSPALRGAVRLFVTELMAKYRMLGMLYLESLRPQAAYGEHSFQKASSGGQKTALSSKALREAFQKKIHQRADRLRQQGCNKTAIVKQLASYFHLSERQIYRILDDSEISSH
jgi:hypothetical protein